VFSNNGPVEVEGKRYTDKRDRPSVNSEQITSGFFDVTGQKLLEGRTFTDEDLDSRLPVAVVNVAFARKQFGQERAIGRRFRTVNHDGTTPGPWRTIVGVVSTVRMIGPFNTRGVDETGFYVPFYATLTGLDSGTPPSVSQFATVLAKPRRGQPVDALANALRREVGQADPNLPLYFVGTPGSQIDTFVAQNRIIAMMFSVFGAVAIVLASVGIYGVMSFAVSQRTQEFGLRRALGANGGRILGSVLKQGVAQVVLGLMLGLGLSLTIAVLLGDGIQSKLFGVSALDPVTYGVVIGLVMLVSLAATVVPARRATQVDPMIALRAD
jgi:putative ABC transport system permease protein